MSVLSKEEQVIKEVKELMKGLGINYFPTRPLMLNFTKGLMNRVSRVGASIYLSTKYNIPLKKFGNSRKMTDEEVKERILSVVSTLKLDRFPTRDEMNSTEGNGSLSGLISKRGGFIKFANELGLELKDSETLTGYKGEGILSEIISSKGYKIERQTANCLYDFLVEDYIRVDCKYSHLYKGNSGNFYAFNLESKMHDCDIFIFICEDDTKNRRVVIVPQSLVQNQGQVSMGEINSKWYKYTDSYKIIDMYKEFYDKINKQK